ncbi:MAG: outer-membrane lipoprotein carrier protein LolA [Rickettsiaceae bacterium]|nr:outer-membrane lipoprotein carrier protein LolA [Rickettsiaceae bacterium]
MLVKKNSTFLFFLLILKVLIFCAWSANGVGTCDIRIIDKLNNYLLSLDNVAIKFTQEEARGKKYSGIILISKPDNFRANYDPPYPLVIVSNKNFITIYDYELEELSRLDAKDNIFKFLMNSSKKDNKLVITSCNDLGSQAEIHVLHTETDQKAKISYDKVADVLLGFELANEAGEFDYSSIKVKFHHFIRTKKLHASLFSIKNPKVYGPPKRYTNDNLLKLIAKD